MLKTIQKNQWQILGVLWVAALLMGISGFTRHASWNGLPNTFWDALYLTVQLVPMNSGSVARPIPLELEIARFFIPLLAGATALKALWEGIRRQVYAARLAHLVDHVVICGLSRKGFLLAGAFRRQGRQVVVVERDEGNDWLEACRQSGMYVLLGDAAEPLLLTRAGVQRAGAIFALCDNDGANSAIALQAEALCSGRRENPLKCLAHLDDPRLCSLMRDQARVFEDRPFHLVLFNVFERGAIRLAQAYPAWRPASPGSPPHILVVGLGRLGQNLVIHLARTWWNTRPDRGWKLEIDVIDRHAGEAIETLSIRCPQLSDAVSFTPLTLEVPSAGFERADYLRRAPVERIYICLDDDALALQAGLCLRSASAGKIPIVMRMAESGGLERLLVGSHFDNLSGFNLLESTCTPDLLDMQPRDILARAVHEEYLRGRLAAGQVPATDPSGQPWDSLDPVLRAQNYRQVDHLMDLCAEAGYTIRPLVDWDAPSAPMPDDLVEGMACREHELWVADRIAGGWRYQPGEKNLAARTNPALLPWDELSEPDREKNRVFVRGIPAFLGQVGYQLTR